jgi:cyclopropane fatty-acyl-phospholipid synthase-like methyltransferase
MTTLPQHLGGHENETHIDDGALSYIIKTFGIGSMVDIGCGPGGMVDHARRKGLDVVGLDGDFTVERPASIEGLVKIHDFTKGSWDLGKQYDLAWTVEFVEHVEEKYMDNFIHVMKQCKYVIMTHAFPGQPGHHHVNCQHASYWISAMSKRGFVYDQFNTMGIRNASTMRERYIRQQSLFFVNGSLSSL